MKRLRIGSWTIEVDVDKTKEFYDNYHSIIEDCTCEFCANYVLACDKFPSAWIDLFESLGIDPRKEGEVSHYIKNEDGTNFYGAFYHIVGNIIEGPLIEKGNESSLSFIKYNGLKIGFNEDLSLVPTAFPKPIIQFEVQLNVPWILS